MYILCQDKFMTERTALEKEETEKSNSFEMLIQDRGGQPLSTGWGGLEACNQGSAVGLAPRVMLRGAETQDRRSGRHGHCRIQSAEARKKTRLPIIVAPIHDDSRRASRLCL